MNPTTHNENNKPVKSAQEVADVLAEMATEQPGLVLDQQRVSRLSERPVAEQDGVRAVCITCDKDDVCKTCDTIDCIICDAPNDVECDPGGDKCKREDNCTMRDPDPR